MGFNPVTGKYDQSFGPDLGNSKASRDPFFSPGLNQMQRGEVESSEADRLLTERLEQGRLTEAEYGRLKGMDPQSRISALKTAGQFRPEYAQPENLIDPESGLLRSEYQATAGKDVGIKSLLPQFEERLGGIKGDQRGLEAIRGQALGTDMPAWARLQMESQAGEERGQRDLAARRAGQGAAQARASMAMRGGLSGGARERLASQQQRSLMDQLSGVAQQGVQQRLGIQTGAEQQRERMLMGLPGMETQALQPELAKAGMYAQLGGAEQQRTLQADLANRAAQQGAERTNIQAALQEKARQDAANLERYREEMKSFGAEKTAQSMQNT